jgi:hypothetical protein
VGADDQDDIEVSGRTRLAVRIDVPVRGQKDLTCLVKPLISATMFRIEQSRSVNEGLGQKGTGTRELATNLFEGV